MSKTDGFGWGREGRVIYLGTAAIDEIEMWPKSSSMVCSMVEVWYGRNPEHVERSESKRELFILYESHAYKNVDNYKALQNIYGLRWQTLGEQLQTLGDIGAALG